MSACDNCGAKLRRFGAECDACGFKKPTVTVYGPSVELRFCPTCACVYPNECPTGHATEPFPPRRKR